MPTINNKLRVFLCHSSNDRRIVLELYYRLNREGWIDPWLDKAKILPGQDWMLVIEKAVEEADAVIVCLSNNSVSKEGFVQRELRYASDIALEKPEETIFLIPCRLEECSVPRSLRSLQWVDYFGADKEEAYATLLQSLHVRREQKIPFEEEKRRRAKEGSVTEVDEHKEPVDQEYLARDQVEEKPKKEDRKIQDSEALAPKQAIEKAKGDTEAIARRQDEKKSSREFGEKVKQPAYENIPKRELTQPALSSGWNFNYTTSDFTVLIILGVVAGIINTLMNIVWSAAMTVSSFYGAAISGLFVLTYPLAYFLVRKPGSMLLLGVIETSVEGMLGNPAGFSTLGWGVIQGIGAEVVMAINSYRNIGWLVLGLTGAISSQAGTLWTNWLYGWSSLSDYLTHLPVNMISGFVLGGLGSYWLGNAVKRKQLVT